VTDDVITWVFDEDSFSPVAKLKGQKQYSILSDYLGTPTHLFNDGGEVIWEAALDSYGKLRIEKGTLGSCPFRYQGQYEDFETGLFFNLNRYYSPEEGNYISQDPIGLHGGITFYGYVHDPNAWIDPLGLKTYRKKDGRFGKKPGRKTKKSLDSERATAVRKAWKAEAALVKKTGKGTREWTKAELHELKTTGKVEGYAGHHINNVNDHKKLAGNPNNIEFVTPEEHLAKHGGDFHNSTNGPLLSR
jgi:RHS repeat-associated protein